jgi:hypothetical protein
MARKPLELPPEVGRSFMADLKAFFAEDNPIKRDEIAAHQVRALNEHRRPRDPKVRLADVKRLFELMRNSRNPG